MRILIFGTVYADTAHKVDLAQKWCSLHSAINPDCHLMLVDSGSQCQENWDMIRGRVEVFQFGDNVGHLARGGRDGWGRAFCKGLEIAIERRYDYVVHIEGDSLCRIDVERYCEKMNRDWMQAASVPVIGTRRFEYQWIETGLMFFDVRYVRDSRIVERYDWQNGSVKKYPRTPEWHLWQLTNDTMHMMRFHRNMRDDCNVLQEATVVHYDWISHARPEIFNAFYNTTLVR